jgi:hypothetical protein
MKHHVIFLYLIILASFEVFKAVTMNNDVYWNVTPCRFSKNRSFEGTDQIRHQGDKNQRARKIVSSN